jgi:8-oxo-dGTP pyrophosphatase MutT (NUDIX family)
MTEQSSDQLERCLERYVARSEAEAFDVRQVVALVADGTPWARSSSMHVTASALIVHPPSRRVLLRWHDRQKAWLQIGGHADAGEDDPLAVALREGSEETGLMDLHPWPTADLQHVVIVPVPANDREPAHHHADLRFVLATQHPDLARPEHSSAPLRWLSFDDAASLTSEDNVKETIRRAAMLMT